MRRNFIKTTNFTNDFLSVESSAMPRKHYYLSRDQLFSLPFYNFKFIPSVYRCTFTRQKCEITKCNIQLLKVAAAGNGHWQQYKVNCNNDNYSTFTIFICILNCVFFFKIYIIFYIIFFKFYFYFYKFYKLFYIIEKCKN